MKEASGELSMTVVVIAAAALIIGLMGFLFKSEGGLGEFIKDTWSNMVNENKDYDYNG